MDIELDTVLGFPKDGGDVGVVLPIVGSSMFLNYNDGRTINLYRISKKVEI